MVSNSALAAVCVWSGLQEHLLFESYALASNMQSYVDELQMKQAQEYELAAREERLPGQYWLEIEPPKVIVQPPKMTDVNKHLLPLGPF
jgi:endoribonuclease Dicer